MFTDGEPVSWPSEREGKPYRDELNQLNKGFSTGLSKELIKGVSKGY